MTVTAELSSKAQAVEAAISDGKTNTGKALEQATLLTEQAATHGWTGMAAAMQGATDALDRTIASLGTAGDAITEALIALNAITEQTGRPQVVEYLSQAIIQFDSTQTVLDAAIGSLDGARRAAEQAGSPEDFMVVLQGVNDDIDDAHRAAQDAKTAIESERLEAASWGN